MGAERGKTWTAVNGGIQMSTVLVFWFATFYSMLILGPLWAMQADRSRVNDLTDAFLGGIKPKMPFCFTRELAPWGLLESNPTAEAYAVSLHKAYGFWQVEVGANGRPRSKVAIHADDADPACVSVEGRPYKLGQIQEHTIADRERSLECVRCDEAWHVLVAWRHNGRVWVSSWRAHDYFEETASAINVEYKTYANNINKDSRRFHVAEIARRVVNDFCHGGERGSARETLTYYTDIIEKDSDSRLDVARYLAWLLPSLGLVGTSSALPKAFLVARAWFRATTTSAAGSSSTLST